MEPIPGILPEQFFKDASVDCLAAFAELIDPGIATMLQEYVAAQDPDHPVVCVIQQHLGDAMRRATFHFELRDKGILERLRFLNLPTVADMRTGREQLLSDLDYVLSNLAYVQSRVDPNTKEQYDLFLDSAPATYRPAIRANRDMFYSRNQRPIATGAGRIITSQDVYDIAYKGLKYRKYMDSKGINDTDYKRKEF